VDLEEGRVTVGDLGTAQVRVGEVAEGLAAVKVPRKTNNESRTASSICTTSLPLPDDSMMGIHHHHVVRA